MKTPSASGAPQVSSTPPRQIERELTVPLLPDSAAGRIAEPDVRGLSDSVQLDTARLNLPGLDMRKAGLTPSTKLVQAEAGHPPAAVAERLELADDEQALIRKRHMFTDGRPAQLAVGYIPLSIAGSTDLAFPDTGPTGIHARLAERGHRVERFVEEVESRRPDEEEAQFLRISRSQHVFEVTRLAFDRKGRVLEVTINVFPSNLWRLSYEWAADD
jgi:GntR family transcriptional regulator